MLKRFFSIAVTLAAIVVPINQTQAGPKLTPSSNLEIAFFSGDELTIGKDNKLIDDLTPSDLALSEIAGPLPGRELARRETGGPDRVLVPLPKAKKFAEDVMRRIMEGAGVTGYQPKIEIVSDGSISASAYPDGTVLLTLGTFRNLESADELAAVLAHEFAHVVLRHHSTDWFMDTQNRGLGAYKLFLDIKAQLDKLDNKDGKDDQFKDMKNRLIAEAVVTASEILVDTPFDQHQEDQADLLGADFLIKANYNPDGMNSMLERLESQEELNKKVREEAKQLRRKNISLSQDVGLFSSIAGAFGEIVLDVKSEILEQFGKDHRPASERRGIVTDYLDLHYADPNPVRLSTAPWQVLVADPDVKSVLDGYRAALNARRTLTTYSIDDAAAQSRAALKALGPEHALPRRIAAEISFITGDFDRAARFLAESAAAYKPSISVYQGLAEAQIKLGNPDDALATINHAAVELSDPPQLLPSKIAALSWRGSGQPNNNGKIEAVGLIAQCRIEGVDGLDRLCEEAAKGEFSVFRIKLPVGQKVGAVDPGSPSVRSASLGKPKRSQAKVSRRVQVKGGSTRVRSGPGTNHGVVTSYADATKLGVIGSGKASDGREWLHVRDAAGVEAWVAGWLVAPEGTLEPKETITSNVAPAPETKKAEDTSTETPEQKPDETVASDASAETPKAVGPDSVEGRLEKARRLFEKGHLSEEEYAAARKRILEAL